MNELSERDREIMRKKIYKMAYFLHVKRGLSIQKVRREIHEVVDATV